MTLGDLLNWLSGNPAYVVFFFALLPLTAFLLLLFARNEGHLSPWKYFYTGLVYLVSVPGIFAITLMAYQFLFERKSLEDVRIFTELLPVFSMLLTFWLIRRNVNLDSVPGFGKLSSLITLITMVLVIMWILDKTRIFVFTGIPFLWVFLILAVFFIVIRLSLKKIGR